MRLPLKRITLLLLALCMIVSIVACGATTSNQSEASPPVDQTPNVEVSEDVGNSEGDQPIAPTPPPEASDDQPLPSDAPEQNSNEPSLAFVQMNRVEMHFHIVQEAFFHLHSPKNAAFLPIAIISISSCLRVYWFVPHHCPI